MGIRYPDDLASWQKWNHRSNLLRTIKSQVRYGSTLTEPNLIVCFRNNTKPQILVALDVVSPTVLAAQLKPAIALISLGVHVALVLEENHTDFVRSIGFSKIEVVQQNNQLPQGLADIREVIAAGHYLKPGAWAYEQSQKEGWNFNVIQHGLNTPFVPPLPAHSTLFAFSQQDAEFWISGRDDVDYEVVGSQLFYEASQKPKTESIDPNSLVFLGQMHGAELPRRSFAQASYRFCRKYGATYRPHPSEKDKLSVLTHKLWAHQGIELDYSGTPLNQLNNPVVSIFSTGVLEAAIRGIPAWVYHPNPPAWLTEFWKRYGMSQWGSTPTPAPAQPRIEPAQQIALTIAQKLEN